MKKFLCLLITAVFMLSFVGCGESKEDVNAGSQAESTSHIGDSNASAESEEVSSEDSEEISTEESEDSSAPESSEEDEVDEEALAQQKREECENALKEVKVELLAQTTVAFEDSGIIDLYYQYETATVLTIGLKASETVLDNYYKTIEISGETATAEDGEAVSQDMNVGYIGTDYIILRYAVSGEIDPSKVTVQLIGEVDDVTVDTKFENNGETVGFENAIAAFADTEDRYGCGSSIIKLKGRHYIIHRRYPSSTGWRSEEDVRYSNLTQSYVLIPLEDGFTKTLTTSDGTMKVDGSVPNTTAKLMINEEGRVDGSANKYQTTISVQISRLVTETRGEDGYSDEVYDKIDDDKEALLAMVVVEIDDGDGNIVTLRME